MNKDDVIRMAREVGLNFAARSYEEDLQKFAALVAAAEREECAEEVEACTSSDVSEQYHIGIMTAVAAIRARGEQE